MCTAFTGHLSTNRLHGSAAIALHMQAVVHSARPLHMTVGDQYLLDKQCLVKEKKM